MRTSASNKKIRELIQLVKESRLIPRPEFQRRLVWSREDKDLFLDSVLGGYPFPEIYLADGEVDLETGEGTQLLVDGLQRISTLIQYFDGDPDLRLLTVPAYRDLDEAKKRDFLQYDVAIRDLGSLTREQVIAVFQRLNATKYSLQEIEVNNALYAGALKKFCESVADNEFFERHATFRASDLRRMGDLRFALSLVGTLIQGYFNRDDAFEELLSRYNDDFPLESSLSQRINSTLAFIDECGFGQKLRVWKKADLFSLVVEMDDALRDPELHLQPSEVLEKLSSFYAAVDDAEMSGGSIFSTYYKAALQASNDRINRVRRGVILAGILRGLTEQQIAEDLVSQGL